MAVECLSLLASDRRSAWDHVLRQLHRVQGAESGVVQGECHSLNM